MGNCSVQSAPALNPKDEAFVAIRDLVYKVSGIYHPDEKLYLLASGCGRRMSACGVQTPVAYLQRLTNNSVCVAELRSLLNEITVGETYMFRSLPQWEALKNIILPQMAASHSKLAYKCLRIWSAGCSTGEEPYTFAIMLREESERLLKGWKIEITATDLNDKSLETAKQGIYGEYALRNVDQALRRKYFRPCADGRLQVVDELKAMIKFDRLNLSDDSRMLFLKGMDVIFCCNVLIYFDLTSKKKVVQHFFSNLVSGGYFFLGPAESLFNVSDSFRLIHFPGATGYWKPDPSVTLGGKK